MMDPGPLTRTFHALHALERRQEGTAHNLANATTPGFRGTRVFTRIMEETGLATTASATDSRAGALTRTGRPLDLALRGQVHLVVLGAEGEELTRSGALTLDGDRTLLGSGGHPVLGQGGPITLPPGTIEILPDGEIRVEGEEVARLRLVIPEEGGEMGAMNQGILLQGVPTPVREAGEESLLQGYLEESNVNPVEALTEMIDIQRRYASLQRSIHVQDAVMDRVANDLGRVR